MMFMAPLFAALSASTQSPLALKPGTFGQTAWVFSTIAHSEWCPAGNVMLDLRSGEYRLTARAPRRTCHDASVGRPATTGRLQQASLGALRAGYTRAIAQGLANADCEQGRQPTKSIITNAGTPVLVLTNGQRTFAAPADLSCWSQAADALHDALDRAFPATRQR